MLRSIFLLLLGTAQLARASDQQVVFAPSVQREHDVDPAILAALEAQSDPVAAMISLDPSSEIFLSQPRLLRVSGSKEAEWMTEGDKLRLRRQGKKFVDITEHEEFYADRVHELSAGKASESTSRAISAFGICC